MWQRGQRHPLQKRRESTGLRSRPIQKRCRGQRALHARPDISSGWGHGSHKSRKERRLRKDLSGWDIIEGAMDIIRLEDQFYILATSTRVDDRTRVLKHGDTFAVFDRFGDMAPVGIGELGLYHEGTRFMSRLGLLLGQERLLLLSSRVSEDNTVLSVDLTNPHMRSDGQLAIPRGTIHVFREQLLWERGLLRAHPRLELWA